jgi:MtfA peptidase
MTDDTPGSPASPSPEPEGPPGDHPWPVGLGLRAWRLRRLMRRPFPDAWHAILDRNVPYCRRLAPPDRQELEALVKVFVAEKSFEGCGGLEVDDEVRVTIAAHACILLLHRRTDVYPDLRTILVYPHAYIAESTQHLEGGIVIEGRQARLGESWSYGTVVLSWDDVVRAASDVHDGHNVVLHEFAHQLDNEAGFADGAPRLPERSMYVAWARVLGAEYQDLVDRLQHHRPSFLGGYAATNPAEFFAVVTELFFEKPAALQRQHPALYEQLRTFYQQDPARLSAPPPSPPSPHTDS